MIFGTLYEKGVFKLTLEDLDHDPYFAVVGRRVQELSLADLKVLEKALRDHIRVRDYYQAREDALRSKGPSL